MKIAIVDDLGYMLGLMTVAARTAGHDTLMIRPGPEFPTIESAAQRIKEYGPDLVFIDDHYGNSYPGNGADLARALGFPPEKLVSISSKPTPVAYCGRHMTLPKREWISNPKVKAEFISLICPL